LKNNIIKKQIFNKKFFKKYLLIYL